MPAVWVILLSLLVATAALDHHPGKWAAFVQHVLLVVFFALLFGPRAWGLLTRSPRAVLVGTLGVALGIALVFAVFFVQRKH